MRFFAKGALSLFFGLLLGAFPGLLAQSNLAALSGTVEDQSGAMVPNVKVWVTNNATSVRREAVSNKEGSFVFASLEPGSYSLRAETPGFVAFEVPNITLNTSDRRQIEISLKVGAVSETMTVSADSVAVEVSSAVSTLVDSQFVSNIPLNGRTFQNLITLTPGVVPSTGAIGEPGQFSVNGQRTSANYFTVDGVSANLGAGSQQGVQGFGGSGLAGAQPALSSLGTTSTLLSVDELDEFRIQSSGYAPEFGRTPGGQVQLTTRSGTKKFHGSASEYFRNDALDSADWFVGYNETAKPPLRQNDFGATFGGPVRLPWNSASKEKTFFFLSYEGGRVRQPNITITDVPSLDVRQSVSPLVQPYLNAFPIPNRTSPIAGWGEFASSYANPGASDSGAIRLDHHFGEFAAVFARYSNAQSRDSTRSGGSALNQVSIGVQALTAGVTVLLSPTLVDELRINYSRDDYGNASHLDSFGGGVPLTPDLFSPYPQITQSTGAAQFSLDYNGNFTFYGAGVGTLNRQKQLNVVNSISKVLGTHQLKFGVDYRRLFPTTSQGAGFFGVQFGSVSDMQQGLADSLFVSLQHAQFRPVYSNTSLYAQDTWRVGTRVTITYGLRWDYNPVPRDAGGVKPVFLKGTHDSGTQDSDLVTAPLGAPFYNVGAGSFAPRVGASFAVNQSAHWATVLSGGVGLFYDLGSDVVSTAYNPNVYPFSASAFTPFGQPVPLPLTADSLPIPPPPTETTPPFPQNETFAAFSPSYTLPHTLQWNGALEQGLGERQSLTINYVGNAGRHLLNQRNFMTPTDPNTWDCLDPNFPCAFVVANASEATSDYHALQVQFQRQMSHGFEALASYTWAHAIDMISDDFSLVLLRASSDFDIRHTVTAALTYELPHPAVPHAAALLRGWSVDGIFSARSARPISIIDQVQNLLPNGKFLQTYADDIAPAQPLYLHGSQYPGGKAINNLPGAGIGLTCPNGNPSVGPFCAPPLGQQGNTGRNGFRSFGMYQLDLSLSREFKLYENLRLQARVDAFNIFNHPNFGDLDSDTSSLLFGTATETLGQQMGGSGLASIYSIGGPRDLQISLKLVF